MPLHFQLALMVYSLTTSMPCGSLPIPTFYRRSEAERLLFMSALQETWSVCGGRVLTAFDLSSFRVVCDVGGEALPTPTPNSCLSCWSPGGGYGY